MKKLALFGLVSAFSASAFAAVETYGIDSTRTFPRFEYNHFGYSTQLSRFDKTTGTVVFDQAAKTGSVDVTIDMKSVSTGSALFNEHIQGEDFLIPASIRPPRSNRPRCISTATSRPKSRAT
jgi:polyisoprenoid-binding protein YceI